MKPIMDFPRKKSTKVDLLTIVSEKKFRRIKTSMVKLSSSRKTFKMIIGCGKESKEIKRERERRMEGKKLGTKADKNIKRS